MFPGPHGIHAALRIFSKYGWVLSLGTNLPKEFYQFSKKKKKKGIKTQSPSAPLSRADGQSDLPGGEG